MTTDPDGRDRFDWQRHEEELSDGAEVVDLDAHRAQRGDPDDNDAGPVLVDSPAAQRHPTRFSLVGLRDGQRRPIVPAWMRSRAEATASVSWVAGVLAHTTGYHLFRLPLYAARLSGRAPLGAWRMVIGYLRWLTDAEGERLRQGTANRDDGDAYLKLSRQRDRRVRWRGLVSVPLAVAVLVGLVVVLASPGWVQTVTVAVLVAVLGVVGRPLDKPLLDTAVVRAPVPVLTSEQVFRALVALNITGINRAVRSGDDGRRWFPAPITRDNNSGWRAEVELPAGVTATEVVERREALASALARPLGCVWPEVNTDVHPGRLVLFVADRDMSRAEPKPWPLLRHGTVDLFKPFAFGADPRGRLVTLTLMFVSVVIGSVPRMGKTFALRLALLGASLDPRAWVLAFDLKGTGDLSPLAPVAYRYRAGDDEEDIEYAIVAMREIRTELRRRTKVIRDLPADICPENKVTPQLASRKALGLHPVVIGVDECQVWFEHPKYGAEFEETCTDLVKRGPAAGITLILATQRPDAKSLPTGISANAVMRFCLKVMGHTENDMVLGTGTHKAGIRATMLSFRDKGIGYLAGEGDDPQITRTFYVDGPGAKAIVTRARALREAAGTLVGHAAGQSVDTTAVRRDTLLDDLAVVLTSDEPKQWSEVVCRRLAALRPAAYDGLTREELTAALKVHGVSTGQVWGSDPDTGKPGNRRGLDRTDILKAITERNRRSGGKAA